MIITIDGPVASGKSSVARLLAIHLGYFHLSSGFLYRSLAYCIVQSGYAGNISEEVLTQFLDCSIEYKNDTHGMPLILINEKPITISELETDIISDISSRISAFLIIRKWVFNLQHKLIDNRNAVVDGRDCGSIVFPNAELKIFLTATPEARAKRLCQRGSFYSKNIDHCLSMVNIRDERDGNRMHSPMTPAHDAITIDNTNLSLQQTLEMLIALIESKKNV